MKNVLASGSATVVHEGHICQVDQPEIIPMKEGNRYFPAKQRRTHNRFGVENCLRVRRVGSPEAEERATETAETRRGGVTPLGDHSHLGQAGDASDQTLAARRATAPMSYLVAFPMMTMPIRRDG